MSDIRDYLRLAEVLLDKFAEALLAVSNMQARLRGKLSDWRFKRINLGSGLKGESSRLFLSSGSSLLRHMPIEARDHFLLPAGLKGAIFFLDDLQNIISISKEDLALMIRDQFQWFGIEAMNYSVCFSAKPAYQHRWIETRPSQKDGREFVYRWRERKPDGGYTKRSEVIGPVSMLKRKPMHGG